MCEDRTGHFKVKFVKPKISIIYILHEIEYGCIKRKLFRKLAAYPLFASYENNLNIENI